jgi:hypothetical protein
MRPLPRPPPVARPLARLPGRHSSSSSEEEDSTLTFGDGGLPPHAATNSPSVMSSESLPSSADCLRAVAMLCAEHTTSAHGRPDATHTCSPQRQQSRITSLRPEAVGGVAGSLAVHRELHHGRSGGGVGSAAGAARGCCCTAA